MAKLKVEVTQDSWDQSATDTVEPPKPGVYDCKVLEINQGYSQGDDKKPDKSRPRLEVIYQITDPKAAHRGNEGGSSLNARLWQYLTFGDNVQWKLAGFLKAFGIPFQKVGGKLVFDLDTAAIAEKITDTDPRTMKAKPAKATGHDGLPCRVKVKPGANQAGEYRAEVGTVLPPKEASDEDDSDFEDTDGDGDGDVVEDTEDEAMDDEETPEPVEVSIHEESDLKAMDVAGLKAVVAEFGTAGIVIDIKGKKKSEVIAAIIEAQEALVADSSDEPADDEAMDDDDFVDDDEEIVDDDAADAEAYTEDGLKAMELPEFKEVAKAFDIKVGGKKKSAIIAEILAAQAGDDSNENPF